MLLHRATDEPQPTWRKNTNALSAQSKRPTDGPPRPTKLAHAVCRAMVKSASAGQDALSMCRGCGVSITSPVVAWPLGRCAVTPPARCAGTSETVAPRS